MPSLNVTMFTHINADGHFHLNRMPNCWNTNGDTMKMVSVIVGSAENGVNTRLDDCCTPNYYLLKNLITSKVTVGWA